MSSVIDNPIVKMQFDNAKFEKNATESIETIKKLKDNMDFEAAAKNVEGFQKACDSLSLARIADAVEGIAGRFTNLGIIGAQVLENLANKAIHTGEAMVRSLTVDQINAGFTKYQDKTTAVQTIVNATGETMENVDKQLEKLAWFTDETSYNFVDMTSNIGKFTSMGIDLETSVTAMQGIATWASVSGQGVNEASRAMYNLAQAVGVGSVKLMDWRSIENANMGTKEFKETAIATAKALGVLNAEGKTAKGTIVGIDNFSQTLSEGWLTKDVLLKTLGKYGEYADEVYKVSKEKGIPAAEAMELVSGEMMELGEKAFKAAQEAKTFTEAIDATKDAVSTGWMTTFENIFGNYEEAKKLWTDLANDLWEIFASGAEARNDLLADWKEKGGRDDLITGLSDAMDALISVIDSVKVAFHNIFPEVETEHLLAFSSAVKDFGGNLKSMLGVTEKLTGHHKEEQWEKIFSPAEQLGKALKRGARGNDVKALQERLIELGYDVGKAGADGIFGPETEKALNKFKEAYGLTVDGVYDSNAHNAVMESLGLGTYDEEFKGWETIEDYTEVIPPQLQILRNVLTGVFAVLSIGAKVVEFLGKAIKIVWNTLEPVRNALVKITDAASRFITAVNNRLSKSTIFQDWLATLEQDLKPVREWLEKLSESVLKFLGISGDLDEINFDDAVDQVLKKLGPTIDVLKTVFGILKSVFKILIKVAGFIIEVGKRVFKVLSPIWDMVGKVFSALGKLFVAFGKRFMSFEDGFSKSNIFSDWLKKIDEIVPKAQAKIQAICDAILSFLGISGDLDNIDFDNVVENIITWFKSIFGIGGNGEDIIDQKSVVETIKDNLLGIYNKIKEWFSSALGNGDNGNILNSWNLMSTILMVVAGIISGKIIQGLSTIVGIGKQVKGVIEKVQDVIGGLSGKGGKVTSKISSVGEALLKFGIAVGIIAAAVYVLSTLSWEDLAKGLVGVGVLIAMLIGSMFAFKAIAKDSKDLDSAMSALFSLSIAILMLAGSVLVFSQLSWENLGKGLAGVTALILVLLGALFILNKIKIKKSRAGGAIGLILVLGVVIKSLAMTVAIFGAMGIESLIKGLASIGIILLMLAGFIKIIEGAKIGAGTIAGILAASFSLLLLIGSFLLLTFAMKLLTYKDLFKGFLTLGGIILSVGLLMKMMEAIHPSIGSILALLPVAVALDLLIAGFIVMLVAIKFSSTKDILKGFLAIGAIIFGVIVLMAFMKNLHPSVGSILALLPIAVALDLLILGFIALLQVVKRSSPSDLLKAFVSLGVIMLGLALVPKLLEGSKPSVGAILALIPISLALDLAIAGFIMLAMSLRSISWNDLLKALVAFSVIILGLAVIGKSLEKTSPSIKGSLAMLISMLGLVVLMIAFAVVLNKIKKVKTSTIIAFAAGLSLILMAFAGMSIAMKFAGPEGILLAAGAILAIGAAIGILIAAVAFVLNQPGVEEFLSGAAEKLGNILGTFSGAKRAAELKAFNKGMEGFGDVAEPDKAGIENMLESAQLLSDFSEGLPASYSAGPIVAWFKSNSPLTNFSKDIVGFAEGFNYFAEMIQGVEYTESLETNTTSAVNISKSLSDLSASLPATYKMGVISKWLISDSPLSNFGEDIAGFASGFNNFASLITGIDIAGDLTAKTDYAVSIASSLSDLSAQLPPAYRSGTITKWFVSDSPLTNFGSDIAGFGAYFNTFADIILGVNDPGDLSSKSTSAAAIASSLSEVSAKLPASYKIGPITKWFVSDSPLTNFGEDIAGFGKYFNRYSKLIKGIDDPGDLSSKSTSAAAIASSLSEVSAKLPSSYKIGPIGKWFVNDSPLTNFGEDIAGFGKYFNNYASMMKGIDIIDSIAENTTSAAAIASSLSDVSAKLPSSYKIGPIGKWFVSDSPLTNFGEDIAGFGKYFNNYASMMKDIDEVESLDNKTTSAASIVESLSTVSAKLPASYKIGPIGKWFVSDSPLKNFTSDMASFADGFNNFAAMMSGVNITEDLTDNTKSAADIVGSIADISIKLPNNYKTGLIGKWFSNDSPLTTFSDDMSSFAGKLESFAGMLKNVTFDQDLTDNSTKAMNIVKSIATVSTELPANYRSGRIAKWFGANTSPLSEFADDMTTFATKLGAFYDMMVLIPATESIDNNTDSVVTIATSMSDISKNLPSNYTSGRLSKWFGSGKSPLSEFADDMTEFATKFNAFATMVSQVDYTTEISEQSTRIVDLAKSISDLSTSLPSSYKSSKIALWFSASDSPLKNFGDDMIDFADKFNNFTTEMGKIDYSESIETKSDNAVKLATTVANFLQELTQLDIEKDATGLAAFFTGSNTNRDTVFYAVEDIATRINNSSNSFKDINVSEVASSVNIAINVMRNLATLLAYLSDDNINIKYTGILNYDAVVSWLPTMADAVATGLLEAETKLESSEYNTDNLASIISGVSDIMNALYGLHELQPSDSTDSTTDLFGLSSLISNAITALYDSVPSFESIGSDFCSAIGDGMVSQIPYLVECANACAQAVLDANTGTFNSDSVNSQSTLFTLLGLLSDGVEYTLTITPIVDMTNAEEAGDSFRRSFGNGTVSFGASTNLAESAASDSDSSTSIKDTLSGMASIVSELQSLKTSVSTMSENVPAKSDITDVINRIALCEQSISNMKMVLDTGLLVGEITPMVDRSLESRYIMRDRRI